jgi:geranylgeranyl diphosphate synthase type II
MQQTHVSSFPELLRTYQPEIDRSLDLYTSGCQGCPTRLTEAIRYSVMAPGKRLRPALVLLACEAIMGQWQRALPAACAVEMIHVYSLIHDDLPSMDDDHLRRGLPTCHIRFDQATAILAGDSLQMLAIEVLCNHLPADKALLCCRILSTAAGRSHLVGGQMDDLAAEGRFGACDGQPQNPLDFLKQIHRRKTSALIEASLQMGGVIGGADSKILNCLSEYGQRIGLAFQIVDDCLDLESTADQMGKATGKDSHLGKLTYPSLLGLAESRSLAEGLIGEACQYLAVLEERAAKLIALAQFVVDRNR